MLAILAWMSLVSSGGPEMLSTFALNGCRHLSNTALALPKALGSRLGPPPKKGGFGLRDLVLRSPAAFLASSSTTSFLCDSIWSEFKDTQDPDVTAAEWPQRPGGMLHGARTVRHAPRATCPICVTHLLHPDGCHPRRTGFSPRITPGPRSWSLACGRYQLTSFQLRRRLRTNHLIPFLDQDTQCPPCAAKVLDRFCDHAAVLSCGGDRKRSDFREAIKTLLATGRI